MVLLEPGSALILFSLFFFFCIFFTILFVSSLFTEMFVRHILIYSSATLDALLRLINVLIFLFCFEKSWCSANLAIYVHTHIQYIYTVELALFFCKWARGRQKGNYIMNYFAMFMKKVSFSWYYVTMREI